MRMNYRSPCARCDTLDHLDTDTALCWRCTQGVRLARDREHAYTKRMLRREYWAQRAAA